MRVLHINCNYTGTSLHQIMVEQLNVLGIQNDVFVPVHTKHVPVIEPAQYVKVSACFPKIARVSFKYKQHKIYITLLKFYNPVNFDLIHAYTLFTDGNCAYELSKRYHLPYIVTVRNTDLNSFFRLRPDLRKRGIEIMKKASAICFLSPAYKKRLFLNYIPKKIWRELLRKTHIIPNGINDFWHCNKYMQRDYSEITNRLKQKELFVMHAGAINKNKNLLTTCLALDELQNEGWKVKYTAVGKVQDSQVAQQLCKRSYVRILNPLPMEKLIDVFREHDMFVMPSIKETFGLVYAEAMSQGLPVIYSKGQGFDEQFPEGYCGYHVPAKDVHELKERIVRIAGKYKSLSQCALDGVSKFRWNEICSKYHQMYEHILRKTI